MATTPSLTNTISNNKDGIAGNETDKFLKTVKVEVNENEPSCEMEAIPTSSKKPKFDAHVIPRQKRWTFQRQMPEYLNTFAIPVNYELPKNNFGKASDSSPSSSKMKDKAITPNHCVKCNISFRFDKHYANHCKDVHGIEKPFPCDYCHRKFDLRHILGDHMNKAHGMKNNPYTHWKKSEPIACHECRETLLGWTKFEQHALSKHAGIKMMSCSHCPKKFLRRRMMLKHEKMQHENMEVKCEICKNIFERSDLLTEHLEFCERRQIYKKTGDNQPDTVIRSEALVCEECGEKHENVTRLRNHLRLEHPHVKLHPCHHCEAAFSGVQALGRHLDMVHPDKTAGQIKSRKKFKRGAIYACEYCEKNFTGTVEYEKHGKQHPGLPMFRCKDCGRGYTTRKSMSNHANEVHGDEKTPCSYCSKCYYRIGIHEKECLKKIERKERRRMEGHPKQYCGICGQDFYLSDLSFRAHVNRHKYYECCAVCGQRFLRIKGGLKEHMERKHPLRENIEALLRTADEVRAFVKREKTVDEQDNYTETDGFDSQKNLYEVKAEEPEICAKVVKLERE